MIQEFINSHYVLFCTKKGVIKKTLLGTVFSSRVRMV